jgi:uncharacterized protein YpuA (DUF1002 family)
MWFNSRIIEADWELANLEKELAISNDKLTKSEDDNRKLAHEINQIKSCITQGLDKLEIGRKRIELAMFTIYPCSDGVGLDNRDIEDEVKATANNLIRNELEAICELQLKEKQLNKQ